jgi:flagellar hook protein FlgE
MVANNLANLNTTGYKSQRIVFSDLMYELLSPATGGNGLSVGGVNPIQLGSGVRTAQIGRNFSQGGFNPTGQPLDFAIQGDGFFVVSSGTERLFTRAGAFSIDKSGFLVNPSNGYHVQRIGSVGENSVGGLQFQTPGDDRIHVPLGEIILGEATSHVGFDGILDATVDGPQAQVLTSASPFESGGSPATLTTAFNDLDSNLVDYQSGDSIEISGTQDDGTPFSLSIAVDNATTIGDLVNAVGATLVGATVELDASGNIVVRSDEDGDSLVSVAILDSPGNTGQTDLLTHSLVVTTPGQMGERLSGEAEIFDVRGGAHALNYQFVKTDINTWSLSFSLPASDGVVTSPPIDGIQFSDDGTLVGINGFTGLPGMVSVQFNDILEEQQMEIDLQDLVQIASPFSMSIDQDGMEPGTLSNLRINSDGTLQGISSAGQVFDIAQMAIALFRNPQGLDAVGESGFQATLNSGDLELGVATAGGRGAVLGGTLEGSNVDVAFEFTQLIVAQRGFSANARTITVADQVLEELTNILR